jgi:hypothetical protein
VTVTNTNDFDKRANPRAKLARKLRVRTSDFYSDHFEELATSVNVSKRGVYFHTKLKKYRVGMRLFVTYPFTSLNDPIQSNYLAEVVRVDELPQGKIGVAIRLESAI